MKGYQLVKEHPNSFEVKHPEGGHFHVAKAHLDLPMTVKLAKLPAAVPVQHLDEGGAPSQGGAPPPMQQQDIPQEEGPPLGGAAPPISMGSPPPTNQEMYAAPAPSTGGSPVPTPNGGVDNSIGYAGNMTPGLERMTQDSPKAEPTPTGASLTYDQSHGQMQSQQPDNSFLKQFQAAQSLEEKGIREQQAAHAATAQAQQLAYDAQVAQQQKIQENYKYHYARLEDENKKLTDAVANGRIDPSKYMDNSSSMNKIGMVLTAFIGGAGAGLSRQPNLAYQVIQDNIAKDIDAQKANLGTQKTLLQINMQRYQNLDQATNATMLQLNHMTQGMILAAAAKNGTKEAQGNADYLIGHMRAAAAPLQQHLAVQQAGLNALNQQQPGQARDAGNGVDIGRFNALTNAGLVDKKEATKELGQYQALQNQLQWTDDAFKRMGDKVTLLGDANPFSQDNKEYQSARSIFLDKLTKDAEGRVTPTTMDNIAKALPTYFTSSQTLANNMNDIKDMLKADKSFPTLTSSSLLNRNDPTISPASRAAERVKAGTK